MKYKLKTHSTVYMNLKYENLEREVEFHKELGFVVEYLEQSPERHYATGWYVTESPKIEINTLEELIALEKRCKEVFDTGDYYGLLNTNDEITIFTDDWL